MVIILFSGCNEASCAMLEFKENQDLSFAQNQDLCHGFPKSRTTVPYHLAPYHSATSRHNTGCGLFASSRTAPSHLAPFGNSTAPRVAQHRVRPVNTSNTVPSDLASYYYTTAPSDLAVFVVYQILLLFTT